MRTFEKREGYNTKQELKDLEAELIKKYDIYKIGDDKTFLDSTEFKSRIAEITTLIQENIV